jgi:hypothetical protein
MIAVWERLAESGTLVLGLAISLYTVYTAGEARILRRRRQYAFLKHLDQNLKYFGGLASHLGRRARQVKELYDDPERQPGFPNPVAEESSLPDSVEPVSRWLVQRVRHMMDYEASLDVESVAGMLNRRQMDALLAVVAARRTYLTVLYTRTMDLEAFPRKLGVLMRFIAVTHLNAEELNEKLRTFSASLGQQEEPWSASTDHEPREAPPAPGEPV